MATIRSRRREWPIVVAALGVFAIAGAGCSTRGSNDPDSFGIYFQNDLSQPVVLAL